MLVSGTGTNVVVTDYSTQPKQRDSSLQLDTLPFLGRLICALVRAQLRRLGPYSRGGRQFSSSWHAQRLDRAKDSVNTMKSLERRTGQTYQHRGLRGSHLHLSSRRELIPSNVLLTRCPDGSLVFGHPRLADTWPFS